jgi:hypothetical protein
VSERERMLERLLAGDADVRDPAVQELFQRDPSAKEEYAALRELEGALERQGDRTRDMLASAERLEDPAGAQRVQASLRELATGGSPTAPSALGGARRLALALAAAALVALAWGLWMRGDRTEPEIAMGDDSAKLSLASPVGAVRAYAPFQWSGARQPGDSFEVRVFDAGAQGAGPMLESGTVFELSWDPKGQAPQTWPAKIQWTLTHYDSSGGRIESRSAEAWLQP